MSLRAAADSWTLRRIATACERIADATERRAPSIIFLNADALDAPGAQERLVEMLREAMRQ